MKQIVFLLLLGLTFSQLKFFENLETDYGDDYLAASKHWVDLVFKEIYDAKCYHGGSTAKTFAQIKSTKRISCSGSSSITLQKAGVINSGLLVSHTQACKKNPDCNSDNYMSYYNVKNFTTALKRAVTQYSNLKKGTCDIVKVMQKYKDMKPWLQQKGIVYIHDSNICVSAGNKKIWSCNSSGKTYGEGGVNPLRSSGYTFNNQILFAIVPRTHGKSNVVASDGYEYKAC